MTHEVRNITPRPNGTKPNEATQLLNLIIPTDQTELNPPTESKG